MNQTTTAWPTVTGNLLEKSPGHIVLGLLGTDYRLHLRISHPLKTNPPHRITGKIQAKAMRVDVIQSGGRYIEPVFGRPRRIQGRIMGGYPQTNSIHVQCGAAVICQLMPPQKIGDFAAGQLVSFDIERGATFEPI